MFSKTVSMAILAIISSTVYATAQEKQIKKISAPPQMTMGNGVANSIQLEGLTRVDGVKHFVEMRVDDNAVSTFRGDSVILIFPKIVIEKPGFIVLHPVMDGRPNGDMVSGFSYLNAGTNEDVAVHLDTPADPGRKFLVMLHSDVNKDRILDFIFLADGINVEDSAVFENRRMIAHIFEIPE